MENGSPQPGSGRMIRRIPVAVSAAFFFFLMIPLAACQSAPSRPTIPSPQEGQPSPTADAALLPAQATLSAPEAATGSATEPAILPSPTEYPVSTATPLPFGACTNGLAFLGDTTFPDRTKVLPGQPLDKSWKVRNSGQCDWGPEYRFAWTGGYHLAAQDAFALYPAAAGSEAEIVIPMIAPTAPGEYTSDWRAVSPLGVPFGDSLYIDIIVAG
jgi:hypothetical protein